MNLLIQYWRVNMFLKKDKRKNGKTYLTIIKGYRDPVTKKSRNKSIMKIGYYEDLLEQYPDPIAHFSEVARRMSEEEKTAQTFEFTIQNDDVMQVGTDDIKNIGFAALSKIYHELGIHKFLINRERNLRANYPLNNIMKLLVYERILHPSSKLANYNNKEMYIENFDFSLETLYRSLKVFAKHKDALILDLHENVTMNYGRNTSNVFYDVTNYYFHTEEETELIAKGYGKDKKNKPIVQMGLLLDKNALPMTYKLFRGNTNDFETLLPVLSNVKEEFHLDRVIVVADKGLNSGTNKAYNIIKGDGYIFSRSLRGTKANKEEKEYALDEKGFRWINQDRKIKSRVYPTEITVENEHGKKVKVRIDEKHIVFYSDVYARRTRNKRNEILSKAISMINSPSKYTKAENYGALKYIKGMKLDKKTGELTPEKKGVIPVLDEALIKEEEKFDGYYSIVTSELDMPDEEVIECYTGLWEIEESFKITKSELKARPVYVSLNEHIEAHFLTCFISLLVLRILEMKTGKNYSSEKLIQSLKKSNVDLLEMNKYKGVYYDEVLECIDKNLATTLNKKYYNLSDIKKLISDTK